MIKFSIARDQIDKVRNFDRVKNQVKLTDIVKSKSKPVKISQSLNFYQVYKDQEMSRKLRAQIRGTIGRDKRLYYTSFIEKYL